MSITEPNDGQTVTLNSPPAATTDNAAPALTPQPSPGAPQSAPANPATIAPSQTQAAQPSSSPTMVSNPDPNANHPGVKNASVLRSIAQTLAGNPQTVSIDPQSGVVTRTPAPVFGKQLALAIALEAISGSIAGIGARGPNATAQAAQLGFQQGQQQARAAQQQTEEQAQADAKSQSDAYVRRANVMDINSRILLNTAEAESRGADTLAKIAATNKPLIDAYQDQDAVDGHNVTQQELNDGMRSGTYSALDQLGPIDGYRLLGNGRVEATHVVVKNPAAKVPLTQELWDDYAANHVQGFPKGVKIGASQTVPGYILARANEQKTMFQLAQQRHDEVAKALRESDDPKVQALASQVPSIGTLLDNPKTGAGLTTALSKFQSWASHADISHGGRDLYESLQAMAQPSMPDPNDPKKFIPNPSAKYANQVAQAFGGMDVLRAYHDEVVPEQINNEAQAADMLASSEPGSRAYKYAQRWVTANNSMKASQAKAEAQAREEAKPKAPAPASLTQPDALGFTPTVPDAKEASKRFASFKKNLDALSQTDQTYRQFQDGLAAINRGDWNGAQSVVDLFSAIGLSAAPLAGRGFRVNQNVIAEHEHARGWQGELQAKLLGAQTGAIITPQQLQQYAGIAQQARQNQYISLANEFHNAGLNADAALPTGNGQRLDPDDAKIFLALTGGNKDRARQAAIAKGWSF